MRQVVISQVAGGLGNQLFCYAAARRFALKNDMALVLDIESGFHADYYRREYALKHFNIRAAIATPYQSYTSCFGNLRRRAAYHLNRLRTFEERAYLAEETSGFDERLVRGRFKKQAYLTGCWQSERYFQDIADVLRKDLSIVSPMDAANEEMAGCIGSCNSVSLHYRSYAEVPQGHPATGLDLDYYHKAVDLIASKIENAHFYCFSDCPEWLNENLHINYPHTIVGSKCDNPAIEDLRLMILCKHHIVANSTFSWWGAWLSATPDKIVIAPRSYSKNADLFPESWVSL